DGIVYGVDAGRRITRLRRLAWFIDAAFRLPGTRFRLGLNSLIGLPPGVGDAALAIVSLYFVFEAARLGAPRRLLARMLGNIAVEAALGAMPVVGDLLDVVWKANLRNVELLERYYGIRPRPKRPIQ
ncbi:MAG TPA: DUF4112 domain-containing protein, partial [Stellaceae bacterium]|nr:DUF4112 domain-containing protein [Stellaceae bacterium]